MTYRCLTPWLFSPCVAFPGQIYPFSIVRLLVKKLLRFENPGRPKFYFGDGGSPEEVQRCDAAWYIPRGIVKW